MKGKGSKGYPSGAGGPNQPTKLPIKGVPSRMK